LCEEYYSPNFGQTQVAQATKELDSGVEKETKNGCEEGQHNTSKEKEVTTEQEQESMRSIKPEYPTRTIDMRCI
jgi:hypothetical protein